jgi:hypothetical protein
MFRAIGGAVMKQEKAGSHTEFCMVIIIGNASLYFGTVEEEFQRATFFSLFFVASANQDFCDLALGHHSRGAMFFFLESWIPVVRLGVIHRHTLRLFKRPTIPIYSRRLSIPDSTVCIFRHSLSLAWKQIYSGTDYQSPLRFYFYDLQNAFPWLFQAKG